MPPIDADELLPSILSDVFFIPPTAPDSHQPLRPTQRVRAGKLFQPPEPSELPGSEGGGLKSRDDLPAVTPAAPASTCSAKLLLLCLAILSSTIVICAAMAFFAYMTIHAPASSTASLSYSALGCVWKDE